MKIKIRGGNLIQIINKDIKKGNKIDLHFKIRIHTECMIMSRLGLIFIIPKIHTILLSTNKINRIFKIIKTNKLIKMMINSTTLPNITRPRILIPRMTMNQLVLTSIIRTTPINNLNKIIPLNNNLIRIILISIITPLPLNLIIIKEILVLIQFLVTNSSILCLPKVVLQVIHGTLSPKT
jgi:hypothetical protein